MYKIQSNFLVASPEESSAMVLRPLLLSNWDFLVMYLSY
jgi:hypothetical protein